VLVHPVEQHSAQLMPFQEMTEVQDRRLIGCRLTPKIDAHEPAHGERLIQRFLRRRVRQVEPVLQEVQPQHPFQADRRAVIADFWVENGSTSAHSLRHGTTCSISATNAARPVTLPRFSKLAVAKVSCRISANSAVAARLL
jgi:hypothetical protein